MSNDYTEYWEHVENLPWYVLCGIGRAGSDAFQSQLDSHPQILNFNGFYFFHNFWDQARTTKIEELVAEDIFQEYAGNFIYKFKGRYDPQERKGELGDEMNQEIFLDVDEFRSHVMSMLEYRECTRKNFLMATYVAHSLCLKEDVMDKRLFFHHIHHVRKLPRFLEDFPDANLIATNRDPRATYVSGVEHRRDYDPESRNPAFARSILIRLLDEPYPLMKFGDKFRVIRTEDMDNEAVLKDVADWMGIEYYPSMLKSTWCGLRWWGDKLSKTKPIKDEAEYVKSIRTNKWEQKLTWVDKFVFEYILNERLAYFRYPHRNMSGPFYGLLAFILVLCPTTYELETLRPSYILNLVKTKQKKNLLRVAYSPIKRIAYYYQLFFRKFFKKPYDPKYFGMHLHKNKDA